MLERFDYVGHVDSHWTPRDASTTPHTTTGAELFPPCGKFVSEHVTVSAADTAANRAGGGIGELVIKAGLPLTRA